MKRFLFAFLLFAGLWGTQPTLADDVHVNGYFRSDGTYVQPHYRSAPDGNVWNNWSTIGNVNPYTGKVGTYDPYGNSSSYGSTNSYDWGSTSSGTLSPLGGGLNSSPWYEQ